MKTRTLFKVALATTVLALGGCQSFVTNMTPARIEANASDIYTFRVKVNESLRNNIVPNTLKVDIVINGETHAMRHDPLGGKNAWAYEYPVPSSVSKVPYYYVITYTMDDKGSKSKQTVYSSDFTQHHEPYTMTITNRYIVKISSSRSPVGATIGILGQGFTETDKVVVGDAIADTQLASHSHLNFTVPTLPAKQAYNVVVRTPDGDLDAGKLYIDPSTIGVQPNTVSLATGESIPLTFIIDSPAPAGGLDISVMTDIPSSVEMPTVSIPEGQRSVSVTVKGLEPGSGFLYLEADGFEKEKVPVEIK